MNEIKCIVSGKVQGVSYRAYVEDRARDLALVGFVQNMPDGTVAVVAQGVTDNLKDFVEALHEGSVLAHVEGVATDWGTAKTLHEDFSIIYT